MMRWAERQAAPSASEVGCRRWCSSCRGEERRPARRARLPQRPMCRRRRRRPRRQSCLRPGSGAGPRGKGGQRPPTTAPLLRPLAPPPPPLLTPPTTRRGARARSVRRGGAAGHRSSGGHPQGCLRERGGRGGVGNVAKGETRRVGKDVVNRAREFLHKKTEAAWGVAAWNARAQRATASTRCSSR